MPSKDNSVTVTGNITSEPELRFTPAGKAVATFGIANNRSWLNKVTQEWEEETSFFDVVAWDDLGANVAESLPKGSRVTVSGRLQQRSWVNDEGEKRYKTEIVADDVAASLRWATVDITRVERSSEGNAKPRSKPAARSKRPTPSEEPF